MKLLEFFAKHPVHPVGALLRLGFWFGVFWLVLGSFITFIPGGEKDWFIFLAAFLAVGVFIPRWYYRVAAIVLVAVCMVGAISGHRHGLEYRRHLQQRSPATPQP